VSDIQTLEYVALCFGKQLFEENVYGEFHQCFFIDRGRKTPAEPSEATRRKAVLKLLFDCLSPDRFSQAFRCSEGDGAAPYVADPRSGSIHNYALQSICLLRRSGHELDMGTLSMISAHSLSRTTRRAPASRGS